MQVQKWAESFQEQSAVFVLKGAFTDWKGCFGEESYIRKVKEHVIAEESSYNIGCKE
jgi:hypothetical protein